MLAWNRRAERNKRIIMYSTLQDAINAYLKRGFGSMNKNDFEVFIFNELLISNPVFSGKSDFDISCELRIPQSKVKRLRYEAGLKFPISQSAINLEIDQALHNARVLPNSERCIEISVENVLVQKYIEATLKKKNGFCDSSFNSEILRFTLEDYVTLLNEIYGEEAVEETLQTVLKEIEKKSGKKEKRTLKELLKTFFDGMLVGAGHWVVNLGLSALPELLKSLF